MVEYLLVLRGSNFTRNSTSKTTIIIIIIIIIIFPFKRSCDVYSVKYKNSLVMMKV